jgi:uncharacterized protein (TIGR02466 family)
MESVIHSWFPRAVYFRPNIFNDKLETYEKEIKEGLARVGSVRTPTLNVDSSHKTSKNIFEVAQLEGLREVFYEQSRYFLEQIGYTKTDTLRFSNCWANISYKGDYIFPHMHGYSVCSGAYYVKSSMDDKIKFFNTPSMLPDPEVWNEYNYNYAEYSCVPGSLLLFPADLQHGTESQIGEEKIVISFNMIL